MKSLKQLTGQEKTTRIKGLLERISPIVIEIFTSPEDQEKIASLLEEALLAHYQESNFSLQESAASLINGTFIFKGVSGSKSDIAIELIELTLKRLHTSNVRNEDLDNVQEIFKSIQEVMQKVQPTGPVMAAQKSLLMKVTPLMQFYSFTIGAQLLSFYDKSALSTINKKIKESGIKVDDIEKDINALNEIINDFSKFKVQIKEKIEVLLFNLGLMPEEAAAFISVYLNFLEKIINTEGIVDDVRTLSTVSQDELFLIGLQFSDLCETETKKSSTSDEEPTFLWSCAGQRETLKNVIQSVMLELSSATTFYGVILPEELLFFNTISNLKSEKEFLQKFKEHYGHACMFSMLSIDSTAKLLFHLNTVESMVQKYKENPARLNAKDLLLIMYLGTPRMRDYIRINRLFVDSVCEPQGYVNSLIIQHIASEPDITFEELEIKARQKPKASASARQALRPQGKPAAADTLLASLTGSAAGTDRTAPAQPSSNSWCSIS